MARGVSGVTNSSLRPGVILSKSPRRDARVLVRVAHLRVSDERLTESMIDAHLRGPTAICMFLLVAFEASDAARGTHNSRKESQSGASRLPRKPTSIPYMGAKSGG
jgi:hypothetical protein